MNTKQKKLKKKDRPGYPTLHIRLPDAHRELFEKIAASEGLQISTWMKNVCMRHAHVVIASGVLGPITIPEL